MTRTPVPGTGTFELDTGRVVHGPETAPQPVFDVRVVDGMVSARARSPELTALGDGRRSSVGPSTFRS